MYALPFPELLYCVEVPEPAKQINDINVTNSVVVYLIILAVVLNRFFKVIYMHSNDDRNNNR